MDPDPSASLRIVTVHDATLRTSSADALLHFENATTQYGRPYSDVLFEQYPEEMKAYWNVEPQAARRIGRLFVSECQSGARNRYIFHMPFSPTWFGEAPLDVVMPQLTALVDQVEKLNIKTVSLFAITLGLFHGPELRGLLKSAFRGLPVTIEIFEPPESSAA